MALLDEVKLSLRVKTDAFNEEIQSLIEAAKLDLYNAGINIPEEPEEPDSLLKQAIKTYCRINFGNYEKAEDLRKAYNSLVIKLQVAEGYKRSGENG